MYFLAIDVGTQNIRAAIVDSKGIVNEVAQIEQEVKSPHPGWAEQQPKEWWNLSKKVIKQVVKKTKIDGNSISAISCCAQMHGPVGIDKDGKITTEWTQIWMDKRCENVCKRIRNQFDESELAKSITANPVTTGWLGIKIKWIKENQPEVYNNTDKFLVPKDFINFKLTGVTATDPSEASGTYVYDYNTDQYSLHMAELLEINLDKFAPIYNSYDIIGNIKKSISEELGLPKNVPVITGGGDFIISLLGLGLIDDSTAVDMTGTSTLFVIHKDKPIIDPSIQNLRHVISGWVPFTMLDCGGLAMKWCKDLLGSLGNQEISYEQMIEMAEKVPVGSDGLLFYPYFLGERRQDNINAHGCFYGLKLNHSASHMARSIMEGVALAIGKDVLNFKRTGVNIKRVFCLGGATRNKLLYKIKANTMQLTQILTNQPEASLQGCGLLAAYGLGVIKDFNALKDLKDRNLEIITPNEELAKKYYTLQQDFIRMYNHLIGYWNKETL